MSDLRNKIRTTGDVIESGVNFEDFLSRFDGQHVEWINGDVIEMSPISARHSQLSTFLSGFFDAYLALTNGGHVFQDPMVMRLRDDLPVRAPDFQVILPGRSEIIRASMIDGPADLVVEIVSPESHRRDRVEKFGEYEQGGVKEYWIIDPVREEALFYQLDADGIYTPANPGADGIYQSHLLDKLRLPVRILWRDELPRVPEIMQLITSMLETENAKDNDA